MDVSKNIEEVLAYYQPENEKEREYLMGAISVCKWCGGLDGGSISGCGSECNSFYKGCDIIGIQYESSFYQEEVEGDEA